MLISRWVRGIQSSIRGLHHQRRRFRAIADQNQSAEILEHRVLLSSVRGRVFDDRLNDGLMTGENGMNAYPVSLIDDTGQVADQTLTDSAGGYVFNDVTAGNYVVQFGTSISQFTYTTADVGTDDAIDSDVDPMTGQSSVLSISSADVVIDAGVLRSGSAVQRALALDETLDLRRARFDDFQDAFGAGEKWIKGERNTIGGEWYFVLPNGDLHAWDGTRGAASGPIIAAFGSDVYENTDLLHRAHGDVTIDSAGSADAIAFELDQQLDLFAVGAWAEGYGSLGVKWMAGRTNDYGNPWYFVTPEGRFYSWDAQRYQATGTLIATLTPEYFSDAVLLTNARRPTDSSDAAVRAGRLREAFELALSDAPAGIASSVAWYQGTLNEFGNRYYFLDDDGGFRSWNGAETPSGILIETLDSSFTESPERLAFADFYVESSNASETARDLDRLYQLRSNGHYFTDWAGAQEKWIRGRADAGDNPWYFILPNGEFYQYQAPGRIAQGRHLATLPVRYYNDPEMLHLAFAPLSQPELPGVAALAEREDFLTEFLLPVTVGADEGTATLSVALSWTEDGRDQSTAVGDVFQIYLLDSGDSSQTLLDNGSAGTPVFSLGEGWFEAAAGIVAFDGQTVSISTESLPNATAAQLAFRLLNGDRDTGTVVRIDSVDVVEDEAGIPAEIPSDRPDSLLPDASVDIDVFVDASEVLVSVENPAFEPLTGRYTADLFVENRGDETYRNVAVVFPGLPDDVLLSNASGTNSNGEPYVSLDVGLPTGGLFPMGRSGRVQISFSNPDAVRFFQEPIVRVNTPNAAPTLAAIDPQTVVPGEVLALTLAGTDTDGDLLSYFVSSHMPLPTGEQDGNVLYFAPAPDEIGSYEFDVVVTDGIDEALQSVRLNVVADPVTTTRVRGVVQNVAQQPLAGVRVTIGALETFTDADGVFFFETAAALPDDAVKIHANELAGDEVYPFIAEKLVLVLEHEVYVGALNDIERPIYLPVLDVAGGSTIDPGQTTVVQQEIAPGEMAAVTVAAGTLKDQNGDAFTGTLSITEVPRQLTPAALPDELIPDVVVTIQPGEMSFTEPAPLTMPNRAGYFPGEEMDLWSINPVTGDFDIVGRGRVTDDGAQIETVEGGIRNSSWHMFIRRLVEALRSLNDPKNERRDCTVCPKEKKSTGKNGASNSQGGRQSMVPDGSVSGSPVRPGFMPGANPFSMVRMPPNIDLNFPAPDFLMSNGDAGSSAANSLADHSSSATPSAAAPLETPFSNGLTNPFGFGIQMPTGTRVGSNVIHSGGFGFAGAAALPSASDDASGELPVSLDGATILAGPATQFTTSEVELHSGSQIESHSLVTYHSLGADRGLSLTYDSRRADPIHLTYMGFDNARGGNGRLLTGSVDVMQGNFQGAKDAVPSSSAEDNWHYRKVAGGVRDVEIPVPIDLTSTPSGVYDYKATTGLVQARGESVSGRTRIRDGEIATVNSINSPYGAGWGINDLIELVEAPDGRVLWINGDGGQFRYRPSEIQVGPGVRYDNAPGDFAVFEKLPNGRFRSTSKAQTVWDFNDKNLLASITDRNGNATRYEYDDAGRLIRMTDPVGLETVIAYSQEGRLSSVTDPANRVTRFEHDAEGNLIRITDPDATFRTFGYDGRHHLISEVDKRGFREEVRYDELGRVSESIRRDLSTLKLQTVQRAPSGIAASGSVSKAPAADDVRSPEASFTDANGNMTMTTVDETGLLTGRSDEEGPLPSVVRDDNNLVLRQTDGRGNVTIFTYDDRGNLLTMQDQVSRDASQLPAFNATFHEPIFAMASPGGTLLDVADIDGDGDADFVGDDGQRLISNGDGSLMLDTSDAFAASGFLQMADMNDDGSPDWVYSRGKSLFIDVNDGSGGRSASDTLALNPPSDHDVHQFQAEDFDGNGTIDLFVLFKASSSQASSGFAFVPGNGDGTFGTPEVTAASRTLSFGASMGVIDYDNDGDSDPLLAYGSVVVAIENAGNGSFVERTSIAGDGNSLGFREVVTSDVNDDGLEDLLLARGAVDVLQALNNGDGTFTTTMILSQNNRQITEMVVGDLNGDQREDIVVGFDDQRASISFAQADGTWSAFSHVFTAGDPNELQLADLDGDTDLDLVVRSSHVDQVSVKLNSGDGRFTGELHSSFFDPGNGAGRGVVRFADGNGDGIPDLFSSDSQNSTSFLTFIPGQGNGIFGEPARFSVPIDRTDGMTLGDVDNDGDIDAVFTGRFGHGYAVLTNDGVGQFTTHVDTGAGGNLGEPLLVDITNDGILDLLEVEGRLLFAQGIGDGTFAAFTEIHDFTTEDDGLAVGDLNGDGLTDIVTTDSSAGRYAVFLANGVGAYNAPIVVNPGSIGADRVALADVDEDGVLDLIGYGAGRLTIMTGDGNGAFSLAQNEVVGGSGHERLAVTDIDNDGRPEILTTNSSDTRFSVFQLNGDGTVDPEFEAFRAIQGVSAFDFADIDGDGDLDLAFAGLSFDNNTAVTTLLNRTVEPQPCNGPCRVIHTYDPVFNQLTSTTDELGRQTLFEIDPSNGNLKSIRRVLESHDGDTIVDDLLTTMTYTPEGLVETMTDPLGRIVQFEYDQFGRQVRKVMAVGTSDEASVRTEYDAAGNVTAVVDENGHRTEMTWDQLNRVLDITNALRDTVTLAYDENGNVTSTRDLNGNTTRTLYDEMDRPIAMIDAVGEQLQMEYDEHGNLSRTTDRLGRETRFRYDKRNRMTEMVDAEGGVVSYEYDFDDNMISTTDENGNRTQYVYDARNRQTSVIDALGGVTQTTYDQVDNPVSVADELNRTTLFAYDDADRLVTTTLPDPDLEGPDPAPVYISRYDLAGNLTSTVDPLGHESQMVYDHRNRLIEQLDPDPDGPAGAQKRPRTQFTYDAALNITSISDPLGRVTTFDYDSLYRVVATILPDPDGAGPDTSPIFARTYDAESNLLSETDPLGNETQYRYDPRYVLTQVIAPDPDGPDPAGHQITVFDYDSEEQLVATSDPLQRTTRFEYDLLGRNTRTLLPDPDGDGPDTTPVLTNIFDSYGNIVQTIDPLGNSAHFEYDALHRMTRQTDADPDGAGALLSPVTVFHYDAVDQLVSVQDPLQRATSLQYDQLGRVVTVTTPDPDKDGPDAAPVTNHVYDLVGNELAMIDALGNQTQYEYDNLYRLTKRIDTDPDDDGPLISPETRFTYDVASQMLSQTDPLNRVTSFAYDDLGRITAITEPDPDADGPDAAPVTAYTYDLIGNELSMTDPLGNVTQYEYDNLYRMTRRTDPDPDGSGVLQSPEWNFTYDIADQMLAQSDPLNRTTSYDYDDLGRLVRFTAPDPDGEGPDTHPVTTYVYDLVGNQLSTTDPLGNVTERTYDNLYRVTSVVGEDPDGESGPDEHPVSRFEYDVASQMTTSVDPLGRVTRYDYDDLARVIQVTEPDPDETGPLSSPVTTLHV